MIELFSHAINEVATKFVLRFGLLVKEFKAMNQSVKAIAQPSIELSQLIFGQDLRLSILCCMAASFLAIA